MASDLVALEPLGCAPSTLFRSAFYENTAEFSGVLVLPPGMSSKPSWRLKLDVHQRQRALLGQAFRSTARSGQTDGDHLPVVSRWIVLRRRQAPFKLRATFTATIFGG